MLVKEHEEFIHKKYVEVNLDLLGELPKVKTETRETPEETLIEEPVNDVEGFQPDRRNARNQKKKLKSITKERIHQHIAAILQGNNPIPSEEEDETI